MVDPDPSDIPGGRISEDSRIDLLLSKALDGGKADIRYEVDGGRELDIVLVDLSPSDTDLTLRIDLSGDGRASVKVAAVCTGKHTKVFSVDVRHNGGGSWSRTAMAGINQDDGILRFLGTSYIANGAHGSDPRQDGRITNLSPRSDSEVSPALLINDDDVKASHGAALGAYDPAAIYYMMSRGLTEEQSKRLITVGSLLPIVDSFADKGLSERAKEIMGGIGL